MRRMLTRLNSTDLVSAVLFFSAILTVVHHFWRLESQHRKRRLHSFPCCRCLVLPTLDDHQMLLEGKILISLKSMYNDHPRDPKFVTIVHSWSLFSCWFILQRPKTILGLPRIEVIVDRWSLAQIWLWSKQCPIFWFYKYEKLINYWHSRLMWSLWARPKVKRLSKW